VSPSAPGLVNPVQCDLGLNQAEFATEPKQQMRWNRTTVQSFLDVRTAVLNDTLEEAFRRRYPGFRPANDDQAIAAEA
jgi:ABC-type glycerol-3-phosphate transport system substrate-binding protein